MLSKFPAIIKTLIFLVALLPTAGWSVVDVGETAPDFSLVTPQGVSVKLSDFADKIVVIFFMGYS